MTDVLPVNVPYDFNRESMNSFIDQIIDSDLSPKSKYLKINFSTMNFIEPAGVTILRNIFHWLRTRGVRVEILYPVYENSTKGVKFLDDAMFFKKQLNQTLYPFSSVRKTTLELQDVTIDRSYQWLDAKFAPWLAERMNLNISSFHAIKMSIGEIFNNIRDHADENMGCIFAQHYPKLNKIKISISDFGVGIPETIRRVSPSLNDHEALEKAIIDGFSSRSIPKNRGAGLHTLIQNVVFNYNGEVQIRSFHGILTCSKINFNELWVNSIPNESIYPGTFIEIILDTESFVHDFDEEEEFEWDL
ncbi:ATP-binding protein [Bacillus subtilis]|uniref:ATP-binding protein n=1 Tax=Bacillus subtilis TaxID=1423 RepID=A0AAQ3IFD1_BACIU|nr:ATP-binding protein [Bacillus subtilis]WHM19890.1 ATP-binding protein [Bacillus subtilis]